MDREAWCAAIHGVTKSWTWLNDWTELNFILSSVISSLISSSILCTYRPGEFIFQCAIFLPFHTVQVVLKARILKQFAIPFSSGPHVVRPLHHDPSVLGGPTLHGLVSFMAVVHVIRLVSFLWLWFNFVGPLMPFLTTYPLTGVSMSLDVGYLLMAATPGLGHGITPLSHVSLQCQAAAACCSSRIKTIPKKKKCQKAKWLSEEALQIAVKKEKWKAKEKRKDIPIWTQSSKE